MKVRNASQRLIYFNFGHMGVLTLHSQQEIELYGDRASAARTLLEGAFKGLVGDGTLCVDDAGAPMPTAPAIGAEAQLLQWTPLECMDDSGVRHRFEWACDGTLVHLKLQRSPHLMKAMLQELPGATPSELALKLAAQETRTWSNWR